MQFNEFNIGDKLLEAISYMGFEKATPIQELAIPEILDNHDLIACAQTGTGKTAAYILPILEKLIQKPTHEIDTLVIVPTRELAIQVEQQIQGFSYFTPVTSLSIYGGGDGSEWQQQKRSLSQGTNIIVATPGKLIAHLGFNYVNFKTVKHLILDEADRMLDIGFYDDIMKIISHLPKQRQTLMFSATMPKKIRKLAAEIMQSPNEITLEIAKPAEGVLQAAYLVQEGQKAELLKNLIQDKPDLKSILIFSSTKKKVTTIVNTLKGNGYTVKGISSDLNQKDREEVLLNFRAKKTRVLIATDVLSRGIDIKDINLVVNFDVPQDAEDYVHRVGRTARAETTGVALTFISYSDKRKFDRIEQLIGKMIQKIPLPAYLKGVPSDKNTSYRKSSSGHHKGRRPFRGSRK